MATSFNGEDLIAGESFSHLLDSGDVMGLDMTASFIYPSSFFVGNSPNMLCFGNVCNTGEKGFNEEKVGIAQRSVVTGSDSSSPSLSNNNNNSSMISKLKKSQNKEANQPPKRQNESGLVTLPGAAIQNRKTCKRAKIENSTTSSSPVKVRKEKLGERITALQQLVSPFGKTDPASVLHEAMAYIRFLHDQIQVLTSPYLQRRSSSAQLHERGREKEEEDETRKNLRSGGLCLVPVACATHVANSNGADFWSPAVRCYSSTSKQH